MIDTFALHEDQPGTNNSLILSDIPQENVTNDDILGDKEAGIRLLNSGSRGQAASSTLEMPYDSTISIGSGVNSGLRQVHGSPFEGGGKIEGSDTVEEDIIEREVVESAYDQAESFEINAEIEVEGWGAAVKAKMQSESSM